MTEELVYFAAVASVLLLLQATVTIVLVRALRRVRGLEGRVAHWGDALALLTETTETGFRAVSTELERLAQRSRRSEPRVATARVAKAAHRGRSVQEIAADERMSEGEVLLRLHMAEAAQGRSPAVASDAAKGPTPRDASSPRTRSSRRNANGQMRT